MEELKNLFSYRETNCDTHDLLDCPCEGNGSLVDKELVSDERETSEEEQGFTLASQLKHDSKVFPFLRRLVDGCRRSTSLMRCMSFGILIRMDGKPGIKMKSFFAILSKMIF